MNRFILLAIFAVGLSGCISLEMPDDLVSDAVDAIKGSDDDESADKKDDNANNFSHSIVGGANAPESELKDTCLSELETRSAELLGTPDAEFTVVSESVSVTGDKAIATCTVSLQ